MGAIERAKIYQLDSTGNTTGDAIDVCFNPKEYSIDKALSWEASKAHEDAPVPEFKSPTALTLTVTLQFDTYEERVSVRDKYVRRMEALTFMTNGPASGEADVKKHAPPRIMFCWGKLTFKGVINSLGQKYTMFLSDGTPVRAEVALKMQQVDTAAANVEAAGQTNLTKKTPSNTCQVTAGDRLDQIAAKQLGSASRWHEIADLNGIDNPFDLSGYSTLFLPD